MPENTDITVDDNFDIYIHGCEANEIDAFPISTITVEMSYEHVENISLTKTDSNGYVPNLDCPVSLEDPDGTDLIRFDGYEMTV